MTQYSQEESEKSYEEIARDSKKHGGVSNPVHSKWESRTVIAGANTRTAKRLFRLTIVSHH
jgi:hypothetical protein